MAPKRGQLLKSAQNGTFSIRFRNDFRWVRDEPLAVTLGHLARRLKMTTRARSAARCLKGAYPRKGLFEMVGRHHTCGRGC